jgi:hypothetical protein
MDEKHIYPLSVEIFKKSGELGIPKGRPPELQEVDFLI